MFGQRGTVSGGSGGGARQWVATVVGLVSLGIGSGVARGEPLHWGDFKRDHCTSPGFRQYSAILWGIPAFVSWEETCRKTPAVVQGVKFSAPSRCVNTGAAMWGEFDVSDNSTCGGTPTNIDLSVGMISQETPMWCWAASGQMTMAYLGGTVNQCTQVNKRLGRTDCCSVTRCPPATATGDCVKGGWPEYSKYGFSSSNTSGSALSYNALAGEFNANRPVAFTWAWVGGGGHMMVARGVRVVGGVQYVAIRDPLPPCTGTSNLITYAEYVQRAGSHTHWDDYYNIKRATAPAGDLVKAKVSKPSKANKGKVDMAPAAGASQEKWSLTADSLKGTPAGASFATPKAAATAALQGLSPDAGFREMGFEPGAKLTDATLDDPLPELMIRLDEAAAYKAGQDPAKLLHDTGAFLVPVSVGGRVQSGITVVKNEKGFTTAQVGHQWLATTASQQVKGAPGAAKPEKPTLVRVPALRMSFLGRQEKGKTIFQAIGDYPDLKLKSGDSLPAATVLERIVPLAKAQSTNEPD